METVARIQRWIENAKEITAPTAMETPQENEDSVSTYLHICLSDS